MVSFGKAIDLFIKKHVKRLYRLIIEIIKNSVIFSLLTPKSIILTLNAILIVTLIGIT